MWPFSSNPQSLHFRKIDADFAVSGQISPEDLAKVAEAGFKSILCARPDNEEPGQPSFATISKAAQAVVSIATGGGAVVLDVPVPDDELPAEGDPAA